MIQINIQMLKTSKKALSLQVLQKHQERVKEMITRIDRYKPSFDKNKNYLKSKRLQIQKRMEQRQLQSDQLFQQNMKLIVRIESTGPKVQTKKFPKIIHNTQRLKTLSVRSQNSSKTKFKILDSFRHEDELFQENVKLITNIETTGPKIECWTSKKVRKLNDLVLVRKREEQKKILQKFKQISKQFNKLNKMRSFKRSSSITSAQSNNRSLRL